MEPLRALADLLRPATTRRLLELGVLDPRRVAAGAAAVPWLVGRGPSLGLLSQINATWRPSCTAVVDRHGELTWRQLDQRVNRLAAALGALGIGPDRQLALLLRNGRELCEGVLAAQKTGVVAAPLNTWARARELAAVLHSRRPAALLYDTRHAAALAGAVPRGTVLVHVGPDDDALPGSRPYEGLLAAQRPRPPVPLVADRGSGRILISTSGTTGTPKAAARSTGAQGLTTLVGALDTVPYRHDDVLYVPNPLFHAFGLLVLGVGLATGATMVLPDAFSPRRAWADLVEHRITAVSFVPVMLRRMLDAPDVPDVALDRLRIVLVSGSALPAALREQAVARFGEVLYDLYGSTEAGWIAIATPESMRAAPEAVGRPVRGVDLALLDRDGRPVTDGPGTIHVRSGAVFSGYDSGEATAETAGYLSTGDLGYLDAEGFLHVVGRADDMVVVGGENVHPDEVEAVIAELPGVEDVAVVGEPDEEMGQVLAAFVVGAATPDEVRAACADQLPSYKVPRRVAVVDEVPRTATGKVQRHRLPAPPAAPPA